VVRHGVGQVAQIDEFTLPNTRHKLKLKVTIPLIRTVNKAVLRRNAV